MLQNSLLNEILRWDNRSPSYLFDSSHAHDNRFALDETYLSPFWDYCKHRIEAAARPYRDHYKQGAFFPWKAQLSAQLGQWVIRIMRQRLEAEPGYTARTAFLEEATQRLFLTEPAKIWGEICSEYPALTFIFPQIIEDFITHALEVAERIAVHAEDISGVYFNGVTRRVDSVGAGVSDLHKRGRSVHIVTYEGGEKVVYKPRDMRVDVAWNTFLDDMARLGGVSPFFTPRVMSFETYAFVEFVDARPVETEREVADFFHKSGYVTCLVYALGGFDFHAENMIAHGNCPVLIDVETVIAAPRKTRLEDLTVISTQFLPYLSITKTLEKGFSGFTARINNSFNLPVLNGKEYTAFDYADEFEKGFLVCYDMITRNRETLLGVDSPVNAFSGCLIRFLKKDTSMYMKTIDMLSTLKNFTFRDEAEMIKKIDCSVGYENDEERELRYGYIPFFTEKIDNLENIFSNIRCFTEERKMEQAAIIRTVLNKNGSGYASDLSGPDACIEPLGAREIKRFVSEKIAAWITLLNDTYFNEKPLNGIIAERTDKRFYITSQHLFFLETLLGIAVTAAAWNRVTGGADTEHFIGTYTKRMSKELTDCPLRIFNPCLLEGASGVAIAMSRIYEFTGNDEALFICADAVEALVNNKSKLFIKHKAWTNPLLYGETSAVFAYASLPETLRRDSHKNLIDSLLTRYQSLEYDYAPEKSGVSELLSLSLLHAVNRCGEIKLPICDGMEMYKDYPFSSNDTFCHGNAGALSALLDRRASVSDEAERGALYQKAMVLGGQMAAKAERDGRFGLNADQGIPFPGFFHGEAGILYSLIRLLSPDEIPQLF